MAEVTVTWNGPAILAGIGTAVAAAMVETGDLVAGRTAAKVLVPYPPASAPGSRPHARRGLSGGLAGAIDSRVARSGRNVTLSVGVPAASPNAQVATWLTEGTPGGRMKPRPWMPDKAETTALVTDAVAAAARAELA